MDLKSLPGIDHVLDLPEVSAFTEDYSRDLVVSWARSAVESIRKEIAEGAELPIGDKGKVADSVIAAKVREAARDTLVPSLKRVVNATGIVIHTNLGRAPLSPYLVDAIKDVLGTYSNLEFDLDEGSRGSRHMHLERLIKEVTGAESGFAVNNNAAAVLVAINTLAKGREVIVSRGELIEIGGSFRIPDIIERGGAKLKAVGTTNKTRASDYAKAITDETALILKVHTSNYKIMGFTEEASIKELAQLGAERGIPVMHDIGSGLLIDLSPYGITSERTVRSYVESGADIITFSGDKLLGGPQAGFVIGKSDYVEDVKKNPMVRALRVGKLTIAAMEAMLTSYLMPGTLMDRIPVIRMLTLKPESIYRKARNLAAAIRSEWPEADVEVNADENYAGGGSMPAEPLPTYTVSITAPGWQAEQISSAMRKAGVPVVGRIKNGVFRLDCRTLMTGDTRLVRAAVKEIQEAGK